MKKSTILLLQKIDKISKNQAISDYASTIKEFNNATSILESHQRNMNSELLYEYENDIEFFGAQHLINWNYSLREKISVQQSEIVSYSNRMELARIDLQKAIKKSLRYDNLS